MKISEYRFKEELESLIMAAKMAKNKDTARGYLIEAKGMLNAYDNVPQSLINYYEDKIDDVRYEREIPSL